MSRKAISSNLAAKEIQESFDWYENRSQGLGCHYHH